MGWTNVPKPVGGITFQGGGDPIGLLLALTYPAISVFDDEWTTVAKPTTQGWTGVAKSTASSWTKITKPTT